MKDIVHRGLTWRDFPGNCDQQDKKFNFALFRRGAHLYNAACEGLEGEALKLKLHELAAQKRRQFGRVGKMRLRRAMAE